MKPNVKSPYFALFLLFTSGIFIQAKLIGNIIQAEVINEGEINNLILYLSFILGYLIAGIAAVCFTKATKKKRKTKDYWLIFFIAPLVFLPIILFAVVSIILLPLYSLVGTQ